MKIFSDTALAIYDGENKARAAVEVLQGAGVPKERMSLIMRGDEAKAELLDDISRIDEVEKKAGTAAGWGGLFGLFTGIVLTPVGPLGPMVLAGPIGLALTGGAVSGLLGALAGWGIAEHKYGQYEEKINSGGILVAVHGNAIDIAMAHSLLKDTDAEVLELHKTTNTESSEQVEKT